MLFDTPICALSFVRMWKRAWQVKDCSLPILGDIFFIVLVLWGAFFTINLLLAVLETNFSQGKDDKVGYYSGRNAFCNH